MSVLRDDIAEVLHAQHCGDPACRARSTEEWAADAILAMPEIDAMRAGILAMAERLASGGDHCDADDAMAWYGMLPAVREWVMS